MTALEKMVKERQDKLNNPAHKRALKILEQMADEEFNTFLGKCPQRTQMIVKGGLVDWREALPGWYIKLKGGKINYPQYEETKLRR